MDKKSETVCPLCGARFDPLKQTCALRCPLGKGCGLICCPNCGYQLPAESKIVRFLSRLGGRKRKADA